MTAQSGVLRAAALLTLAALAVPVQADVATPTSDPLALLQQAVSNSRDWIRSNPNLALEYLQTVEIDDGEALRRQVRQVDERQPPALRVTLISVNGEPPDAQALGEFRKQRERDIKRARKADEKAEQDADDEDRRVSISFQDFDLSDARLLEHRSDRMVFDVPNAVRSMLGESNSGMAEHLTMQVEVDPAAEPGPYLSRLTVESSAPFKPGMIGKVERFRMQMDLQLHDSGRLVMDRMDVDLRARALFRDIESRQQVAFSEYLAHPVAAGETAN